MRGRLAVRQFRHLGVVGLDCGVHAPLNIKAESKTDCWGRIGPRGACHRQSGIVGRCPMRIKIDMCSALGITLMHIDENDWVENKSTVLSKIKNSIEEIK